MASKTVLITGCSKGGIGDALAREFRRRGLRVFASARNPDKMQHFADLKIETLVLDVTSKASIKAAVETVRAATDGRFDYLINAAGSCMRFPPSPGFAASNSSQAMSCRYWTPTCRWVETCTISMFSEL
jgi:1-acylglycerone phosphate reductase